MTEQEFALYLLEEQSRLGARLKEIEVYAAEEKAVRQKLAQIDLMVKLYSSWRPSLEAPADAPRRLSMTEILGALVTAVSGYPILDDKIGRRRLHVHATTLSVPVQPGETVNEVIPYIVGDLSVGITLQRPPAPKNQVQAKAVTTESPPASLSAARDTAAAGSNPEEGQPVEVQASAKAGQEGEFIEPAEGSQCVTEAGSVEGSLQPVEAEPAPDARKWEHTGSTVFVRKDGGYVRLTDQPEPEENVDASASADVPPSLGSVSSLDLPAPQKGAGLSIAAKHARRIVKNYPAAEADARAAEKTIKAPAEQLLKGALAAGGASFNFHHNTIFGPKGTWSTHSHNTMKVLFRVAKLPDNAMLDATALGFTGFPARTIAESIPRWQRELDAIGIRLGVMGTNITFRAIP